MLYPPQFVTDYAAQQLLLIGSSDTVLISLHVHHAPPDQKGCLIQTQYLLHQANHLSVRHSSVFNETNRQKERWREEAARQKARLPDLFKDTERPKWSKPSTTLVFLLTATS